MRRGLFSHWVCKLILLHFSFIKTGTDQIYFTFSGEIQFSLKATENVFQHFYEQRIFIRKNNLCSKSNIHTKITRLAIVTLSRDLVDFQTLKFLIKDKFCSYPAVFDTFDQIISSTFRTRTLS